MYYLDSHVYTGGRMSRNLGCPKIVSSLYLYCQAHRPIDVNQFVWSFKLLKAHMKGCGRRSLESSTAELNNLAALNPAANKMEEWLLKVEKEQKVSQRENYTKLQKELEDADNSGEIYGSTSIKLDRDGKIYKHVDSFDFEPKFISDPKLREQYMDK
eukprot:gene30921-38764_t